MNQRSDLGLRILTGATVLCVCSFVSSEEPSISEQEAQNRPTVHDSIDVIEPAIPVSTVSVLDQEAVRSAAPLGDGAEALRGVTGAELGRMGGHGLEAYIRGQGQANLTVLLDGATLHGGCPNRMDPPTSFATLAATDRIVIIRGVQTLRYGPGAPGGTLLYDRQLPALGDASWSAQVTTGVNTWSKGPELTFDAALTSESWSLRAIGSARKSESYEDGDGTEVRSAAESRSATVMTGWQLDPTTSLELSYERTSTDDALFAGAGMDAPEDTADIFRLQSTRAAADGSFGWQLDAFYSEVSHLMDNYSLRPLTVPMAMKVPAETSTWGFRGHLELGDQGPILLGLMTESAEVDATRLAGPSSAAVTTVQSIMWPEIALETSGVFIEGTAALGASTYLVYGARVDHFTADSARADERAMGGAGPSPRQLWSQYHVEVDDSWSDTELGALLRLERLSGAWRLLAGLSRTIRVADATERFLASNSPMTARRWIGNPGLDPARYHQLDLGAAWHRGSSTASLTLFAADVDGYILRDRAHGQEGVLRSDNATIYRNADARRLGVELEASHRLSKAISLSVGLAWVRAETKEDDRPIAQTPPLNGHLTAAWSDSRWSAAGTLRWAARQHRVDDDPMTGSGQDAGPTPSWASLDLNGSVELGAGVELTAGVTNVLDRTYANHLNRASLFDPDPVRVNEPGRTFWLRLGWSGKG